MRTVLLYFLIVGLFFLETFVVVKGATFLAVIFHLRGEAVYWVSILSGIVFLAAFAMTLYFANVLDEHFERKSWRR